MKNIIIGVMGPGNDAGKEDIQNAYLLGQLIAKENWILLSGGRNIGVMDAVNKGAKESNGLTIGVIASTDPKTISSAVDIPIITGMGSARNIINVLSSDVVIACGMGAGTASEVALTIKANKNVVLLTNDQEAKIFFKKLGKTKVHIVKNPKEAIKIVNELLNKKILK